MVTRQAIRDELEATAGMDSKQDLKKTGYLACIADILNISIEED